MSGEANPAGTGLCWDAIDTVLLDMDGTLLDLRFDNHFWLEHVPARWGARQGLDVSEAKAVLYERMRRVQGTLDWYCLDYWTRELGLDVAALKHEVADLIRPLPDARPFLAELRASGRRILLVTNAHRAALRLKLARTGIAEFFDGLISSHDLGAPKEDARFWRRLRSLEPFEPDRTLMVDDSLSVLRAARACGVAHIRAVRRPDSGRPARDTGDFEALESLADLLPVR
ncbi:MAG: GMP/IMP nucleotidase [Gammaproteobacteria bacterium]|jgi:putative hydrolase of the HAD superfamily